MAKPNLFNSIKVMKKPKNNFDLTHDVKMSCKMGNLYPCMIMDVVPSDEVRIGGEALVRMAPMIAPMMHRVDVSIHYFFVPNRILWDNWEKFISPDFVKNPVLPAHPYVTVKPEAMTTAEKVLLDYLGIPTQEAAGTEQINALPLAAYQCIYNEYYRDQNLIGEVNYKLQDGGFAWDERPEMLKLRTRAWEHDYFTSCLPFAQKGPAVKMPVTGDVVLKENWQDLAGSPTFRNADGSIGTGAVTNDNITFPGVHVNGNDEVAAYDPVNTLEVQNITSTINDFRRATKLQEWLELAARAGSRYKETIWAFFNTKSPDSRLQRPEYITGVKSPISISEVLNTTGVAGERPQGDMAGHGIAVVQGNNKAYHVQEHGWIIGVMSVMPKTAYQQGIHKSMSRFDVFDYYWPQFANIGEQEVKNREVYAFHGDDYGDETFGYIPRYAEYKFLNSRVAGDFKTTLAYWHMGRIFGAAPALNQEFIECVPRKDVFAVPDEDVDEIWCQVVNKVYARRMMPVFGTPTI